MLQNRVDPFGTLIKTKARGTFMGNRGLLHSDQQEIRRPFKLMAWITCKLEFKGWKRPIMAPRQYTELFFLDEATAFAAGHRPCAECRREEFTKFKMHWLKGNPEYKFTMKTPIREIDAVLHKERIDKDNSKVTYEAKLSELPDGTFVTVDNQAYLLKEGQLYAWTAPGYSEGIKLKDTVGVKVLTPRSVVNTFKAGYVPGTLFQPFPSS